MAGVLEDIKTRGELIAGVKPDYPPFANRDKSGAIVGLEVDLAQDLADRLGVKLKLFPVSADGRIQFLQQGSIDVLIATMAVTEPRRRQTDLIEPYYYATRIALLTPKNAKIASLADLKDKPVCTILHGYCTDELSSRAPQAKLIAVRSLAEGAKALHNKRCAAFADENAQLFELKNGGGGPFADHHVVSLDFDPLPWAIAVRSGEKDTAFGKLISAAVTDWHKSGRLIALEKKWLGENTRWLLAQHEALK